MNRTSKTDSVSGLSISTQLVINTNEKLYKLNNTKARDRITKLNDKNQTKQEELYLSQTSICPVSQLKKYQNSLATLEAHEFKKVISDNFYNADVMKAAACISDSIFYTQGLKHSRNVSDDPSDNFKHSRNVSDDQTNDKELGAVSSNQRLRRWLRNLQQIGAEESAYGVALKADLDDADSVFVVKAPKDPENAELLHELFVGLQLNSLRTYVPNFAYVFGGFKCSPPVIDVKKEVIAWCNNTDVNVQYILYENIAPAVTMKEYCKTCTFHQWLEKYLQILYALHTANKKIDFTHYDLHDENVLIRDISDGKSNNKFSIPYQTERGGTEYLLTDKIATIIDYGMSHVKVKDIDYGSWGRIEWGIMPDSSFPLHDAYKLLLFSMHSMRKYDNLECFEGASKILKFFNPDESPDYILDNQINLYYSLPFNKTTMDITIFDLTKFIRLNIPEANTIISTTPHSDRILGCFGTDVCITSSETVEIVGAGSNFRDAKDPIVTSTVFDLYDLVTRLHAENRMDDINDILKRFSYKITVNDSITKYNQLVAETNDMLDKTVVISIAGLPVRNLFDKQLLTSYRDSANIIANLFNNLQEMDVFVDAITYVAMTYKDKNIVESMNQQQVLIDSLFKTIDGGILNLKKDIDYLEQVEKTNSKYIHTRIKKDRIFSWWWKGLPNIKMIF